MSGNMKNEDKTGYAKKLLTDKAEKLGCVPKKTDFSPDEVCFIKQKLGPWSRALEAVGLKEAPAVSAKDKSRIKRERSRKNRKAAKKTVVNSIEAVEIKEETK